MKTTLRHIAVGALRLQLGSATIEYAIVCVALAVALLAPVMPGTSQTAGQLLASKIRDLYNNLTFFLSLP